MNQEQTLLWEILRPIWLSEAERTGKMLAYCKLKFVVDLNRKLGIESNDIVDFDKLTTEQIEKAIEVYEPIINELSI